MAAVQIEHRSFGVRRDQKGRVVHLYFTGELDLATSPDVGLWILQAERPGVEEIVVDLEQVSFIDSSAVHTLLRAAKRASDAGRILTIARPSPVVTRILELTGNTFLLSRDLPTIHKEGSIRSLANARARLGPLG